jgi:hypothetical protein
LSLNANHHEGSFIFTPFFNWYSPFFTACSLVLARVNGSDADRSAVELQGADTMKNALVLTSAKGPASCG